MVVMVPELCHLFFYVYLAQSVDVLEQYLLKILCRDFKLPFVYIVRDYANILGYIEL